MDFAYYFLIIAIISWYAKDNMWLAMLIIVIVIVIVIIIDSKK